MPASGTEYTVTKTNEYGWLNTDFVVTAAEGYELSAANAAEAAWVTGLTMTEETDNGNISFYVRNKTTGAISLAVTETYKIDKTAPVGTVSLSDKETLWDKLLEIITFGCYYNDEQKMTVDANDVLSDIAKAEYVEKSSVLTSGDLDSLADSAWRRINGSATVSLEDAKKFVYYIRLTDKAGNIAYLSTNGATYDITAPVINGIVDDGVYCSDVTFTVTEANLSEVTADGTVLAANSNGSYTIKADNNTHIVTATDKAGNSVSADITVNTDHSREYSTDGVTITETCKHCGGVASVTVSAPTGGRIYDGEAHDAVLSYSGILSGGNNLSVSYERDGEIVSDTAQAGTYTASVTYNGKTAGVTYTVSKAAVTVTADDVTRDYGDSNPAFSFTVKDGELVDGDTEDELGVTLSTTATEDSEVGSYAITGISDSVNYNVTVLEGTLEIVTLTELPEQEFPDDDALHKVTIQVGLNEVPDTLKHHPKLNTVKKIMDVMKTIVCKHSGYRKENSTVYEVTLMVSLDGGRKWEKATEENFPENGLTVILPYPAGTGKDTHDFAVTHMFTSTAFGKTPGDTENPIVTKTDAGIQVTVTGLSPIAVAWTEIESTAESESGSTSDSTATGLINTGDSTFLWLWVTMTLVSGFGILYLTVYRGRQRRKEKK